ncbi:MAG TPA: cytochrome b/b6 domain-containing protein [Acidimicrobiales bacterium]
MRPTTTPARATTTEPGAVVRNNRATRWFHAATFLVTAVLLATGWWLRTGHEGSPSLLAEVAGRSDADLHRQAGWASVALAGAGVTLGVRAAWTFVRETLRVDRGDARWFRRWPVGALAGRFAPHAGHFDPGQRLANVAFVATLGTIIGTGVAMTTLSGGPVFASLVRVHRVATYVLTALVAGHLLVVAGVLPGYRGAWRAMIGGRGVAAETARRLWPADAPDERGGGGPQAPASPDRGAGPGSHRHRD